MTRKKPTRSLLDHVIRLSTSQELVVKCSRTLNYVNDVHAGDCDVLGPLKVLAGLGD
ncbi:hypothetical protein J6590_025130 [Homalodisca vitripennis]|nr:hypothetical protein J6590_025130 [Homalodisca vitripennis]